MDNWHEMQHDFGDIFTTAGQLRYIHSDGDFALHSSRDLTGRWLANPVWSMDESSKRLFIAANEHGDIIRFLELYRAMTHPTLPISIVNFDQHIDDREFQKPDDAFSSWQRHIRDKKITTVLFSYNIMAVPARRMGSDVTQVMLARDFITIPQPISLDVLSVDMDVYNGNLPGQTEDGDMVAQAIDNLIPRSRLVMLFLSPAFTKHGAEETILRDIFNGAIERPVNPLDAFSL